MARARARKAVSSRDSGSEPKQTSPDLSAYTLGQYGGVTPTPFQADADVANDPRFSDTPREALHGMFQSRLATVVGPIAGSGDRPSYYRAAVAWLASEHGLDEAASNRTPIVRVLQHLEVTRTRRVQAALVAWRASPDGVLARLGFGEPRAVVPIFPDRQHPQAEVGFGWKPGEEPPPVIRLLQAVFRERIPEEEWLGPLSALGNHVPDLGAVRSAQPLDGAPATLGIWTQGFRAIWHCVYSLAVRKFLSNPSRRAWDAVALGTAAECRLNRSTSYAGDEWAPLRDARWRAYGASVSSVAEDIADGRVDEARVREAIRVLAWPDQVPADVATTPAATPAPSAPRALVEIGAALPSLSERAEAAQRLIQSRYRAKHKVPTTAFTPARNATQFRDWPSWSPKTVKRVFQELVDTGYLRREGRSYVRTSLERS